MHSTKSEVMVKQTSDETRNSDDHCMRRCSLQHHSVASECNYITAPSETLLDTNVIQSSIDNVIRSFEGNSTTTTHTLSPSHHVEDILLNHSGYVLSTCSDEDSHNGRLTTYTPAQPTISSSDVQSHDVERILRHDSVTMALGIDLQKNGVPSCKGHKMKREWRNVGWFTNAEAMNEVRKREKVSKRKSVVQVNGTKVFYRCNRWRRTNCNYRMFAMYYAPNRISLNESGYHDHSTPNRDFKTSSRNSGAVFEATASSSQQHVLDQLVLNATVNSSHLFNSFEQENVFEPNKASSLRTDTDIRNQSASTSLTEEAGESSYQLKDGHNISQLLQIAADMDLTFTFNSRRTSEYCFESNLPEMKGRMVVFSDFGGHVSVTERQDGQDRGCEQWKKADWHQFLWAVRGKCMKALKGV